MDSLGGMLSLLGLSKLGGGVSQVAQEMRDGRGEEYIPHRGMKDSKGFQPYKDSEMHARVPTSYVGKLSQSGVPYHGGSVSGKMLDVSDQGCGGCQYLKTNPPRLVPGSCPKECATAAL